MERHPWVPGNRIWKTALAATVSWAVAGVVSSEHPFFAPLAAVLCMQATVEQSLTKGMQRVLGIVMGVILAGVALQIGGPSWWSIGLLLLVALTAARVLRLPEYSVTQTGISALLMFTIGAGSGHYGLDRILETMIGAAIASLINLLVAPPDYTRIFADSLKASVEEMSRHCRKLAAWLDREESAADGMALQETLMELCHTIEQASDRMEQAIQALKFSPFVQSRRKQLERYRNLLHAVNRGYARGEEIQRLLVTMAEQGVLTKEDRKRWAEGLERFAGYMEEWWLAQKKGATPYRLLTP
ncbi:aromatic acid exporter family protein [Paenibacillus sp. CC-CFT747]|nr:aromatic acid exporter family protein [Paenibacillus sp. CC-CFT747]